MPASARAPEARGRGPPASVASAQQPETEATELRLREPAGADRVILDDPASSRLVFSLDHPDARVDRPKGRTGKDQLPLPEQATKPLAMRLERGSLLVGQGRGEVLPRRMQKVDPRSHKRSLPHTRFPLGAVVL